MKLLKSYTGINLIDHARPAQYKFKPKRAYVVLVLTFLYMALLLFGFFLRTTMTLSDKITQKNEATSRRN